MKNVYLLLCLGFSLFLNAQVGNTCENPIVISSLPYTTTDNTANYANNYNPDPQHYIPCSGTSSGLGGNPFHRGNDVIYSYTSPVNGTVKFEIPNAVAYTGMILYTDCNNIGLSYAGCSATTSGGTITINDFPVTAGQAYYILISSYPSPQTVPFTLNVTQLTILAVNDIAAKKKEVGVYPNPAETDLNFKSENNIISAAIYTMEGKKIKAVGVKDNSVSVEGLSTGNYIIEFADKSGNIFTKVFTKK